MRIGELLAMKWANLDYAGGRYYVRENVVYSSPFTLSIGRTKTDYSTNPVDLTPRCLEALKIHQQNQARESEERGNKYPDRDLIFPNHNGGPYDRNNVANRIFLPTLKKAGLRRIRIHDLRHTCAALLIHQGESPKYIQRQMRHATIQVTFDVYGHLFEDVHQEATKRLDRTLFGES